jgi:quinol monooxygenase YgiN
MLRAGLILWVSALVPCGAAPPAGSAAPFTGTEVAHVAILRFNPEHLDEAMQALHALAAAARRERGNLAYDVWQGVGDAPSFFSTERWASAAALAAHERTEGCERFGRNVLGRYATRHDTVTARAFDAR